MKIESYTTKSVNIDYQLSSTQQKVVAISNTISSLSIVGNNSIIDNKIKYAIKSVKNIASNIKKLGDYCFYQCYNLSSVNISDNIKYVGSHALAGCSKLNNINLIDYTNPSKLLEVGSYAFSKMPITKASINLSGESYQLSDYNINQESSREFGPYIEEGIFSNCQELNTVNFLNSVEISKKMFSNCFNLSSVNFQNNYCSYVGSGAFENCISLKSFIFNENWTSFPDYFFDGCINLKHITINNSNGSKFYNIGNYTFKNCSSLSTLNIPSNIKLNMLSENSLAFSNINKIYIPNKTASEFKVELNNYSNDNTFNYPNSSDNPPYKSGMIYQYSDNLAKYAYENSIPLVNMYVTDGNKTTAEFDNNIFNSTEFKTWVSTKNILFSRLDKTQVYNKPSQNFSSTEHSGQFFGTYDPYSNVQSLGMWYEVARRDLTQEFIKENSSNIEFIGNVAKIWVIPKFKSYGHNLSKVFPMIQIFFSNKNKDIIARRFEILPTKEGFSQIKQICSTYFNELDEISKVNPIKIEKKVFNCYNANHDVDFVVENGTKTFKWDNANKKMIG